MEYFVNKQSIVREIWGKSDTILFIFAGAAAEFALSKAVDWLYFTGRLPADPIGRLFSTVSYARQIVFSEKGKAIRAIDAMASIHAGVEAKRGARIPDWAYRDVLFMLIDYSIKSFEILERRLNVDEKREVFDVFYRMGFRMGIQNLPQTFEAWETARAEHMEADLVRSEHTDDLFRQYRKHLGLLRFKILREVQILVAPKKVRELLGMRRYSLFHLLPGIYKLGRMVKADRVLKAILFPAKYKDQLRSLDHVPAN